mgnify:CR=1 FL=1
MERKKQKRQGATRALLGLLGIGFVFALAGVPQIFAAGTMESRDQARVSSLYRIQQAITSYHQDRGALPWHTPDRMLGGWETSLDGAFLMELVEEGYLTSAPMDPINDDHFHFRYCVYGKDTWEGNQVPFYVLGAVALENPLEQPGPAGSFQRGERSWNDEFDFVLSGP